MEMRRQFGMLFTVALWTALLVGFYGALSISYNTITGTDVCPDILGIPVCYLVAVSYFAMILSVPWRRQVWATPVFLLGWLFVFGFALPGSTMELLQGDVCPRTDSGIPLCYISLLLSLIVVVSWVVTRPTNKYTHVE